MQPLLFAQDSLTPLHCLKNPFIAINFLQNYRMFPELRFSKASQMEQFSSKSGDFRFGIGIALACVGDRIALGLRTTGVREL